MERIFNGLTLSDETPPEMKQVFVRLKPLCSELMSNARPENLSRLLSAAATSPRPALQEMQLYMLFPIVHHLKSSEFRNKYEVQRMLVDGMVSILKLMEVTSIEAFVKYHNCLIFLVFDKEEPGMVAQVPEELKLSVMNAITSLVLRLTDDARLKLYRSSHTPLIAQCIYIAVQIAKLDKLRSLRLAAMECVQVLVATHPSLVGEDRRPRGALLAAAAADVVSGILPGVVGGLQDVAVSSENQGHAITAKAVTCIHCAVCLVMEDRTRPRVVNTSDRRFAELVASKRRDPAADKTKGKPARRSPEYFLMAGQKLKLVTKSLMCLQTHEHPEVRTSLATFCSRVLLECAESMAPSVPFVLDALIALSEDRSEPVAALCRRSLRRHLGEAAGPARAVALDCLAQNLYVVLTSLPRVMNNVDTAKKISALNLLCGYLALLSSEKLTEVLSCAHTLATLSGALVHAVKMDASRVSLLLQHSYPDIEARVPDRSPWVRLAHLDDAACEERLRRVCGHLAAAGCAAMVIDHLLEMFREGQDRAEVVYLMNCFTEAAAVNVDMVLATYIEPETWHLPLEVGSDDPPLTSADTLDPTIYNPRTWERDSVPGLYEGTVETRYTDISYQESRVERVCGAGRCRTLRAAQDNMVLACLMTEGVGVVARQLREQFQPYLLRTLCLLLERVGSKYEMLRGAGLKALRDVTRAGGHADISALVRANADYFTYQVTMRLKKSWNSVSALQILTVVMQHSDASILTCLQGIITDVLLQSCDRYHSQDVTAYLQVFLTFLECVHRWYPESILEHDKTGPESSPGSSGCDILADTLEYIKLVEVPERLLDQKEFEREMGQTTEEMFKDDLKGKKEEEELNYENVNPAKLPLPEHASMTLVILKRSLNFMSAGTLEERLLAILIMQSGLPILSAYEDELLPLCHAAWPPLAACLMEPHRPTVLCAGFRLLVTVARHSGDFMRSRAVREVLPKVWHFLESASEDSLLKDAGSSYRTSPTYRAQLALLEHAGELAVNLQLRDRELEELLEVAAPYLSSRQPKPLQAAAVKVFRRALAYDEGATWHKLRRLGGGRAPPAPPPHAARRLSLEAPPAAPHHPADKTFRANINAIFAA